MVDNLHSLIVYILSVANIRSRCWSTTSHLILRSIWTAIIHHFPTIKSIEFRINWFTCEESLWINSQLGRSITFVGWSTFTRANTCHGTLVRHIREGRSIHINSECTRSLIHPWSRGIFFGGIEYFTILSLEFVTSICSFTAVDKSGRLIHKLDLWIIILRPRNMLLWDSRCDGCLRVNVPLDNTASSLWLQSWIIRTRSRTVINLKDYK